MTPAVLIAAPIPAITPHPRSPATFAGAEAVDLRALAGVDQRLVGEGADSQRRRQLGAVLEGHLLAGVVGVEADPRLTATAGPALAAHRSPVEDHEVAWSDVGDPVADLFDDAGSFVAEEEREVVVDAALAVVQVGVADPACLDGDDCLAWSGVGDDDRLDGDRLSLGPGDDAPHGVWHAVNLVGVPSLGKIRVEA